MTQAPTASIPLARRHRPRRGRERAKFADRPQGARLRPPDTPRVVVEAASPQGWEGLAGPTGRIVGLDRSGASAPAAQVLAGPGFTVEALRTAAHDAIEATAEGTWW